MLGGYFDLCYVIFILGIRSAHHARRKKRMTERGANALPARLGGKLRYSADGKKKKNMAREEGSKSWIERCLNWTCWLKRS